MYCYRKQVPRPIAFAGASTLVHVFSYRGCIDTQRAPSRKKFRLNSAREADEDPRKVARVRAGTVTF